MAHTLKHILLIENVKMNSWYLRISWIDLIGIITMLPTEKIHLRVTRNGELITKQHDAQREIAHKTFHANEARKVAFDKVICFADAFECATYKMKRASKDKKRVVREQNFVEWVFASVEEVRALDDKNSASQKWDILHEQETKAFDEIELLVKEKKDSVALVTQLTIEKNAAVEVLEATRNVRQRK